MPIHFFDASALVKRYHEESGTSKVDEIFESDSDIVIANITIVEVISALIANQLNKRHAGVGLLYGKAQISCSVLFVVSL